MLNLRAYHDSHEQKYREPFGAVPCGTSVNLKFTIITETPIAECQLRVWGQGDTERLLLMKMRESQKTDEGYQQLFEIDYPAPEEPGLIWYYFRITIGEQVLYYGNNEEELGGKGSLRKYEPPGYQITVYLPNQIPSWFKEGIMYQIFVDRFYKAEQALSKQSSGVSLEETTKRKGLLHLDWNDTPFYIRDEEGRIERWTFFGGNLAGIIQKLEYLRELGITILYLNPIFEAPSNHKYDTADYLTIDSMFGDEELFRQLVQEAAKRGIAIILDGVFSHTGSDSIYFNKEGNYPELGAFQSPESPYYNWYIFTEYPHRYESWWGVDVLPNVNEMEPSYREFIYEGENSVVRHWLKAGAKGWRLDVADELPDEFIKGLRKAIKEIDEEGILIGEVWEDASNKISYGQLREYFWGEELDSTMNYPWRQILIDFLLGKIGASKTHQKIMSLYENYPRENFYAGMNLLGSHDRIRILTLLGEAPREETLGETEKEKYKLKPEARALAVQRLKQLSLVQMTFPGVPCIYYGDEAGLEGYSDPYNRGTYPWGQADQEILAWHQRVIRLRQEYQVLREGDFTSFHQGDDVYGFQRQNATEQIIVFVNRSLTETKAGKLPIEAGKALMLGNGIALDLLAGTVLPSDWEGTIQIPPLGVQVIYLRPRAGEQLPVSKLPKASGILLSVTSLPAKWGVGDFGIEAYKFVDFLAETGQKIWQILPLNPLGAGNSPYQSVSTFAGDELFLDIEQLLEMGLLKETQVSQVLAKLAIGKNNKASYALTREVKEGLYREGYQNFRRLSFTHEDYQDFLQKNSTWLADYSLYIALKKEFGDRPWYAWEEGIARREKNALAFYREKLREEIDYHSFLQYIFATQWQKLKSYANAKGILIMGDLPIYVAADSCNTWVNRESFALDETGKPLQVAGVPPDYFSDTGQLWGNPLYDWEEMRQDGYAWWVKRIRHVLQMTDYLRLDHFRGFEAFWEIPKEAKEASEGRWLKGPGKDFFELIFQELKELPFIAEDLGFLTPEVHNLKNIFGLPGIKVFQFSAKEMLTEKEPKSIYYTGTHDNDTLVSWCSKNQEKLAELWDNSKEDIEGNRITLERQIIEKLYSSEAPWVIVPFQDILGLDGEARMNIPGTPEGNWEWRFNWELVTDEVRTWLRELVRENGR